MIKNRPMNISAIINMSGIIIQAKIRHRQGEITAVLIGTKQTNWTIQRTFQPAGFPQINFSSISRQTLVYNPYFIVHLNRTVQPLDSLLGEVIAHSGETTSYFYTSWCPRKGGSRWYLTQMKLCFHYTRNKRKYC